MRGVNKAILIGVLGKDPEKRVTPGGTPVCSFSIAIDRETKSKSGEKSKETTWLDVVLYDKLAEIGSTYLKKGQQVYIEGRISVREYQGRDGKKHKQFEIVANSMQMIGGKGGAHKERKDQAEEEEIPF